MNELRIFNSEVIPVYITNTGEKVVYGRELQEKLHISKKYVDWMDSMISYGFSKEEDYEEFWEKDSVPQMGKAFKSPQQAAALGYSKNHLLKFDMAKHIAMMQRTPEGKTIRQKLIDLEEEQSEPENNQVDVEQLINNPDFGIKLLTTIKEEREKNKTLKQEIEKKDNRINEMRPKEIFADSVSGSESLILVRDLAKLICQNGVDIGERRLYKWMRENKYITKTSKPPMPTQEAMEMGLFHVVERTVIDANGNTRICRTTMITGKGQQYFINKFVRHDAEQITLDM